MSRPLSEAVWKSRTLRRGKILQLAATFLRSLNEHSDLLVRQNGLQRCEQAQAQYAFARDLADSIDTEIKDDRKYVENRNYNERQRERRRARRDNPDARTPTRTGPYSRAGRDNADADAAPE